MTFTYDKDSLYNCGKNEIPDPGFSCVNFYTTDRSATMCFQSLYSHYVR